MSTISYAITPAKLASHIFEVEIRFPSKVGQEYTLSLPAWLPGSYMIRDFAKNIITLAANTCSGETLQVTKKDKQTWCLTATDSETKVSYQVYAFDLSVRTAFLDNQRGFFNGSSTFLHIQELPTAQCQLTINQPQGMTWKVATGLKRSPETALYQCGQYWADDYQQLIDCPVELGNFDVFEFTVSSIPHYLVFAGKHFADRERLITDVTKLCQHHIDLFGEAPFEEYWFITNLVSEGFGGLEHKNSTVLQAGRFDLPNPNKPDELNENYQTFLSLCSHEYFHAWNVCRIKPEEFVPYNLQEEVHTTQLWAYEGITSYYDDFSLYRAGIIKFDDYLKQLSKTMTRVYRGQGELKQSVSQSSFDTWTKFYKQGPDAVNNIVSYYTKGSLIALWLDLTIRKHSKGQCSLDNLMRELWVNFGKTGIGTTEQDFITIANQLCSCDISETFKHLLHSAERVPLTVLLAMVGVSFSTQKFAKLNSLDVSTEQSYQPYLGAMYKGQDGGLKLSSVVEDSPIEKAGLSVNDIILAIDHTKVTTSNISKLVAHLPEQTPLSCHYFRDDKLIETELTITDSPSTAISLSVSDAELNSLWTKVTK